MSENLKLHPIQLQGILVKELFIRINNPSEPRNLDENQFQIGIGHSDFDEKDSTIDIGLLVTIGNPDSSGDSEKDTKFDLKVHLLAKFLIDKNSFPIDKIDHWAEHNAPLILYPYLREHVHGLSVRAGIDPILLPLMELPTFSINK